ncbi:uncharacterized protein LOC117305200 [Asterias rubens]|uniref:uncharacterized protein LOC117305200 n=1 Tax=Asterias rubens TaxID=7604 RepID=UPI001454F1B8|nr:uncharacterized protein LOC117305200 [Asterias rubens]
MAKKTRATSRAASLDPTSIVEPPIGDLPDTASNNTTEPNMPEAAKEIPSSSDAATMATPKSESKVTEAAQNDDDAEVPDLNSPADESESPEAPLDHDTQELDDELLEDALHVEEVKTQEDEVVDEQPSSLEDNETENRKRPLETIQPDEVIPAKKMMSEVNQDGSANTIQCEE